RGVVHLELAGHDPATLGVEFLGGQFPLAQVAGAEDDDEAEQGKLTADLAAHTAIPSRHHGHRLVSEHAPLPRWPRPRRFPWLSSCHQPIPALTLYDSNRHLTRAKLRPGGSPGADFAPALKPAL